MLLRNQHKKKNTLKYIEINFDAWILNGSDKLWLSIMETFWKHVEDEFGALSVKLHRASVKLAGKGPEENESPKSKSIRRNAAL